MELKNENELGDFKLGKPALVCRWRLANGRLPLANRHLRALKARAKKEALVTDRLVAWAKQHIEWTLADGSAEHPDGVLMLVVDEAGQAAMTVGPYTPFRYRTAGKLALRAQDSAAEGEWTGIAPELLWAVRGETLVCAAGRDERLSGTASLIADLARTLGVNVVRDRDLLISALSGEKGRGEVFLSSDEHGIVVASDAGGRTAEKYRDSYLTLMSK